MDILVLLADVDESVDAADGAGAPAAAPIARVRSTPDPRAFCADRPAREVVTLYGAAEADRLAVAIAAAFEGRRSEGAPPDAVWEFGVWADRGAVGDVAWRDRATGRMVTQAVAISAASIAGTAGRLLVEHGRAIRQTVAGLAMTEWPEGARRAIQLSLGYVAAATEPAGADAALLALLREADGDHGAFGYDAGAD